MERTTLLVLETDVPTFCCYSRLRMPGLSDKRFLPLQTCLYCQTAGCSESLLTFIVRRSVSRSSFCLYCQNQTCLLLQFCHKMHNIQLSFLIVRWPGEFFFFFFFEVIFLSRIFFCVNTAQVFPVNGISGGKTKVAKKQKCQHHRTDEEPAAKNRSTKKNMHCQIFHKKNSP